MGIEKRISGKFPTPGPYLAEITNNLDSTYMGMLEVALVRGVPASITNQNNTFVVRYLSPFYGATSVRYEGNNSGDFNDVQKSYGMWMVPPTIGTTVMVIFVDCDPNQGYWIGCVPNADKYQNHMVPGIAASGQTELTAEQSRYFGTSVLPVAEFLKKTRNLDNPNVAKFTKPVHPFAYRLREQGLLLDDVRGITSSGARREVPSQVFGISTPGPLDTNGPKKSIGYGAGILAPVSRLGGSTFVMDDGDINGQNELIRIRTRTGHQILLHNSSDLIYIGNSKGTAWIELTSSGKLDIYANDSVSIRTEADFNLRADRDFNIEAGNNVNIKSFGNTNINSDQIFTLISGNNGLLNFNGTLDITSQQKFTLTSSDDLVNVVKGNLYQTVNQDIHVAANGKIYVSGVSDLHFKTGNVMYQSSGKDFNVSAGGNYYETATQIHMNGPGAVLAASATAGPAGSTPTPIPVGTLPNTSASTSWMDGNFYTTSDLTTILKRAPTHEPYRQHETSSQPYGSTSTSVTVSTATSTATTISLSTGTNA
jgi:hypothetical protein